MEKKVVLVVKGYTRKLQSYKKRNQVKSKQKKRSLEQHK